ncbi:MAG TPA: malto-oligosyltrehalose synthase [Geminicoccaceae bacterium]|nr:malto-oligosyltrehalose synthase [Geminicoccaceae bacterium]
MPVPTASTVPRATIRVQLRKGFGFDEVRALVPYFADVGFSHVYASPFLKARPGSTHGYDVTDPNAFNPEIGDDAGFDRLVEALHAREMGLILDFVPNHVGVHGADNPWWLDVLEWGRASPYARFFDIDWEASARGTSDKVLLPLLGDHYGNVLVSGDLKLRFDPEGGSFSAWYHQHRFPINPRDYALLIGPALDVLGDDGPLADMVAGFEMLGAADARRSREEGTELKAQLAALTGSDGAVRRAIDDAVQPVNGTPGRPRSFRTLHQLLEGQAYRVAYWRVAADEINYRRFFDINDLAGLRMERPEVFEETHRLVLRLLAEGKLQGLRLDHVDGLFDPAGYCHRLQRRAAEVLPPPEEAGEAPGAVRVDQPIYLVVEKILARFENLPQGWPVAGTTGYEFMNLVNGLFVDPAAERSLTNTYHRAIQREHDFDEMVVEAKRFILENNLSSELQVLAFETYRLAQQSLTTRDYTLNSLRDALIAIIANFPVYRTYVTAAGLDEEGRRYLDWAVARARKATNLPDSSIFDFLYKMLSADLVAERGRGYRREDILSAAMRAQQLTSPVMAKSLEDTTFYRHVRLVSLNEVGGEPNHFGVSPAAFHRVNRDRLRHHPHSMLATATHDHKRGEDTRVRIDALSEMPAEWRQRVQRWFRFNRFKRREIDGRPAPGRNDEYLLYQMLVGAWPLGLTSADADGLGAFAGRILGYMIKATREAKQRSSWIAPNAEYEGALESFVRAILDARRNAPFLDDLIAFQGRTALVGAVNGLSQTLLRLTAPGVPDTYQGCELWDLTLVDPDNRRPPDFDLRRRLLNGDGAASPGELLADWRSGRIKQHVIARTLDLRRRHPALFGYGDYEPVEVAGAQAERVVAFVRRHGDGLALTVAPRLVLPLLGDGDRPMPPPAAWGDTTLRLPSGAESASLTDVLTGAERSPDADGTLRLADVLSDLPVALLARPPA